MPKRHAWEIAERIDRDGAVVVELDEDEARAAIRALIEDGRRGDRRVPAVVVPQPGARAPDPRAGRTSSDPGMFVSLSCEVSPRIREFARSATTIMSTQVGPGPA